jgi:hypothetical protein
VNGADLTAGASADNAYASHLGSYLIDMDIASRIKLLMAQPFAREFSTILHKLKWTEFPNIFRTEAIVFGSRYHIPQRQNQAHVTSAKPSVSSINKLWQLQLADSDQPTPPTTTSKQHVRSGIDRRSREAGDDDDSDDDQAGAAVTGIATQSSGGTTRAKHHALTPKEIESALIGRTNARLELDSRGLDFGVVKREVERELGLPSDFWGKNEQDPWFWKSKKILKKAVVSIINLKLIISLTGL